MKVLAVETSTDACSAALFIDGVVTERFELTPKEHTRLILPMIDNLMSEAGLRPQQLDALAFSCGPGSFTGVRIATGVIQGIALGADLPVVPVSTLAAIAMDFFDSYSLEQRAQDNYASNPVAYTAMDARMGEIFWGVYQQDEAGLVNLLGKEAVTPALAIEFPELIGVGVGSGWGVYKDELLSRLNGFVDRYEAHHLPRASAIVRLGVRDFERGLAVPVEQAMPVYLRDKVAQNEVERQAQKQR
ncbi:MAG: tRNA (adenosine(37)-N6)-threonylcarbamoyltransferase complex dimerization subunit type 1 TsaB [Methylococcales bacterium]|nr:MAG: tRNA (adenosine(37)-N6)-threonylcarbamoyltransferase complex dimerization subunit type 1 TsaB [Methylococcales bacterium]